MATLVDRIVEVIRKRQTEIAAHLTTAPLNKVEKLQGQHQGLDEAVTLVLDLLDDNKEDDA
jgi:hypothetical protein